MIYDISPTLNHQTAVWPGDIPLTRKMQSSMQEGKNYTLSSLHTTVHIGAHTDAPNHYSLHGKSIDLCDLEPYIGVCQVVRVNVPRNYRIKVSDLTENIVTPRVLFATGTFPDINHWNNDFAALSRELIEYLSEQNVKLVGIDTPSVDLYDCKSLEVHHCLHKYQIAILEGIDLSRVKQGTYELIALPLKLEGFDASPVRAILRDI